MSAHDLHAPSLLSTLAIDRLEGQIPDASITQLRTDLRQFRAWVAEPAFRAATPEAAVAHVIAASGPGLQLKQNLIQVLVSVPNVAELLVDAAVESFESWARSAPSAALAEALAATASAQRFWFRLATFHPKLAGPHLEVSPVELAHTLLPGFLADHLLTLVMMASDGESDTTADPAVVAALETASAEYAHPFHRSVLAFADRLAPSWDPAAPFKPTSLDDLMSLPPHDGAALTVSDVELGA